MHVIFICASQKKAISRVAAVLDGYAFRMGDRTWQSPMTDEGLAEVRMLLRRSASKNTAVACWRNDGRTRMRLLWTVGKPRTFGPDGRFPVASRNRVVKREVPAFVRAASLLATAGGLAHDLGKYSKPFQDKLRRNKPIADAVRHEWMSSELLLALNDGAPAGDEESSAWQTSWEGSWKSAADKVAGLFDVVIAADAPYSKPLETAFEALRFIVVTHHRLPQEGDGGNVIRNRVYFRDETRVDFQTFVEGPQRPWLGQLARAVKRCKELQVPEGSDQRLYWRAAATLARMALILSDHSVSSQKRPDQSANFAAASAMAYANTTKGKTGRVLNQRLHWHLDQVGASAGEMVQRLMRYEPPTVCAGTRDRIDRAAGQGRFAWQDEAAAALRPAGDGDACPTLVLNLAATGTGKTRANVRLLSALRGPNTLRISTLLNLRSLTYQTAKSYASDLGIGADELSTVTGDRRALELSEATVPLDEDENPEEPEFETEGDDWEVPAWLKPFFESRPVLPRVLCAPVLISTIDFMIAAGEPGRQAHHALAMLRLMGSDLVLDEIDSYDPKAFVAVSRLVLYAGFWGRNVVASSATLAVPVAQALVRMYAFGRHMRCAAFGKPGAWQVALVSDAAATVKLAQPDMAAFDTDYEKFINSTLTPLAHQRYRPVKMWPMTLPEKTNGPKLVKAGSAKSQGQRAAGPLPAAVSPQTTWFERVADAALKMHECHHWEATLPDGTMAHLSIGLVRVANISVAIELARHLAKEHAATVRVACYHSQLLMLHRWYVERVLDELLTRKDGEAASRRIAAHPLIESELRRHGAKALAFVVVATPVEEIGRDHDFDWAVIEPSSTQSIIQCAGRVNRHRRVAVEQPNVALLQLNKKAWDGKLNAFTRPGLQSIDAAVQWTHDLAQLLNWKDLKHIDARMRFGNSHKFARFDDCEIRHATEIYLKRLTGEDRTGNLWMSDTTYLDTPLRATDQGHDVWRLVVDEWSGIAYERRERTISGLEWIDHSGHVEKIAAVRSGAWLAPALSVLMKEAQACGLDAGKYLEVQVRKKKPLNPSLLLKHDLSFGFMAR